MVALYFSCNLSTWLSGNTHMTGVQGHNQAADRRMSRFLYFFFTHFFLYSNYKFLYNFSSELRKIFRFNKNQPFDYNIILVLFLREKILIHTNTLWSTQQRSFLITQVPARASPGAHQ